MKWVLLVRGGSSFHHSSFFLQIQKLNSITFPLHSSKKIYLLYFGSFLLSLLIYLHPYTGLQVETLSCGTRSHQETQGECLMWNQRWVLSLLPSLWTTNRTKGRNTLREESSKLAERLSIPDKVETCVQVQASSSGFRWEVGRLHDCGSKRGQQE